MNLTDDHKRIVTSWINEGLKLSEIQTRLAAELDIRLTYMEVRMLVDDLRLMPKDPPAPPPPPPPPASPKAPATGAPSAPGPGDPGAAEEIEAELEPAPPAGAGGKVSLTVDKLAVPGALVSGSVTFSDGKAAQWYLDEMGRLGIAAKEKGYRPPPQDVQSFQLLLQRELQRLGF